MVFFTPCLTSIKLGLKVMSIMFTKNQLAQIKIGFGFYAFDVKQTLFYLGQLSLKKLCPTFMNQNANL